MLAATPIRSILAAIALASTLAVLPSDARDRKAPTRMPCDLEQYRTTATRAELDEFVADLRAALRSRDVAALALLVDLPLRVNFGWGATVSIDTPEALRQRLDWVFPPTVTRAIATSEPACGPRGISFGQGDAWATIVPRGRRHGFVLEAINLQDEPVPPGDRIAVRCDAERVRAVVVEREGGKPRLRLWRRGHRITGAPDVEVPDGEGRMEGSAGNAVWEFHKGATTYMLTRPVLTEGPMPAGATGALTVHVEGKRDERQWCF